jgi:hypothetical protein
VVALLTAGAWVGFSTAVGAVIALGNFHIYRWVVSRITGGNLRKQSALSLLLAAKMIALMGLIYLLVARHWVDPLGFLVGLSALVLGLLAGSILYLNRSQTNT